MEGFYRLFGLSYTQGQLQRRYLGRFAIHNGHLQVLESRGQTLHEMLPDGEVDETLQHRLQNMAQSPYFQLINEQSLHEGHYPDLIPEMDLGEGQPDAIYSLQEPGQTPQHLEIWGETAILDGRRLTPHELDALMARVEAGKYMLQSKE